MPRGPGTTFIPMTNLGRRPRRDLTHVEGNSSRLYIIYQ